MSLSRERDQFGRCRPVWRVAAAVRHRGVIRLHSPASFVKMECDSETTPRGFCDEEVGILGHLLLEEERALDDELFLLPEPCPSSSSLLEPSPSAVSPPHSFSSSYMDLMVPLEAAEFSFPEAYSGAGIPANNDFGERHLDPVYRARSRGAIRKAPRTGGSGPGSGRICAAPDCVKSSQSRGLCIRHGGGKRCAVEGCTRGAQATGRCKSHGGGVRCKVDGCEKSSQGSGLCRTHGGGKICLFPGCKKGTQRGGKCSTHGGARICIVDGCKKVDRGGGMCGIHKKTMVTTQEHTV